MIPVLPNHVLQMDYDSFAEFVLKDLDEISKHSFDCVIGKLRNGIIPASIIANRLQKPMGVIEIPRDNNIAPNIYIPQEILSKKNKQDIVFLYVDSICSSGISLKASKQYFEQEHLKMISYATFIHENASTLPDIYTRIEKKFVQPPWEWLSYTPQAHLERLETGNIKGSTEDYYCIGFSSAICKEMIYEIHNLDDNTFPWAKVYESNLEEDFTYDEAITIYKSYITDKEQFVKDNGITHFIEHDWVQAILLSELCPVTEIIYFDGSGLHKIYSKKIDIQSLTSLKF